MNKAKAKKATRQDACCALGVNDRPPFFVPVRMCRFFSRFYLWPWRSRLQFVHILVVVAVMQLTGPSLAGAGSSVGTACSSPYTAMKRTSVPRTIRAQIRQLAYQAMQQIRSVNSADVRSLVELAAEHSPVFGRLLHQNG